MGIEFNPNIKGKYTTETLRDAATLERTTVTPLFNFRAQKTEFVPELKPKYVERIECSAENGMNVITSTMPNSVAEQKNAKEFTEMVNNMLGFDYTVYVTPETAANAAMNPYLA